jgi:hypothetical protein
MSRSSSAVVIPALLLAMERVERKALDTRGNAEPGFVPPSSRPVLRCRDAQVVCVPVVDPAASAELTLHHY